MVSTVEYRATQLPPTDLAQRLTDQIATALAEPAWGVRDFYVRVQHRSEGCGAIIGQVNFTAFGRSMRTQAACERAQELATVLIARLSRQMAVPRSGLWVRPWPDPLAQVSPVPIGPAVIRRHKRVGLRTLTPADAILTLDALDYQAHIFLDPQTEAEAVVYRGGPCGYRLVRAVRAEAPRSMPAALVTDSSAPPKLTLAGALMRLMAFGEPHLFFTDASTGRSALLYARYAGGYGLVEPRQ